MHEECSHINAQRAYGPTNLPKPPSFLKYVALGWFIRALAQNKRFDKDAEKIQSSPHNVHSCFKDLQKICLRICKEYKTFENIKKLKNIENILKKQSSNVHT